MRLIGVSSAVSGVAEVVFLMAGVRSMPCTAMLPDQTVFARPAPLRMTVRKHVPSTISALVFTLRHRQSLVGPVNAVTTTPLPTREACDDHPTPVQIGECVSLPTLSKVGLGNRYLFNGHQAGLCSHGLIPVHNAALHHLPIAEVDDILHWSAIAQTAWGCAGSHRKVVGCLQELCREICSDYGFNLIETKAPGVFTEDRKSKALMVYPSNVASRELFYAIPMQRLEKRL